MTLRKFRILRPAPGLVLSRYKLCVATCRLRGVAIACLRRFAEDNRPALRGTRRLPLLDKETPRQDGQTLRDLASTRALGQRTEVSPVPSRH